MDIRSAAPSDLTSVSLYSIDGAGTRDIDDAFTVEATADGLRLVIAIANAAALVPIGSQDDKAAQKLGATVYMSSHVVHSMLPRRLVEQRGSLTANSRRQAIVYDVRLDKELEVQSLMVDVRPVRVEHRLVHADVPAILQDPSHVLHRSMQLAQALGMGLLARRRSCGALALYDLARLLVSNEDGEMVQLDNPKDTIGYIIVQEVMILANTLLAEYLASNNIPAIFRNHEARAAAPSVRDLCKSVEMWVGGQDYSPDLARKQLALVACKSTYGAHCKGHYALGLPAYVHLSSPLRRYPDLVNQRQLIAHLAGTPLPYTQEQLVVVAEQVNEAIERRKDERSQGYKAALARVASLAVSKGAIATLAEHELIAAVKLARQIGHVPEVVETELTRRMRDGSFGAKLASALLSAVPLRALSMTLRQTFGDWLRANEGQSYGLLLHGESVGVFIELKLEDAHPSDGVVHSSASARVLATDQLLTASAKSASRRVARSAAARALLFQYLALPTEAHPVALNVPARLAVPAPAAAVANYKGLLLEFCQARRLATPSLDVSATGPAHLQRFGCIARLSYRERLLEGRSEGATTKRSAENAACAQLLAQLRAAATSDAPAVVPVVAELNPIGALMELCQKRRYSPPEFRFAPQQAPSAAFRCDLTLQTDAIVRAAGDGATKQAAKASAARAALEQLAMPACA